MFVMPLIVALALSARADLSLRSMVAGNWSTSSNGKFRVLYFVPVYGIGHFQALLDDKFLDVFVTSPTSARVVYENYNFTFAIANPNDGHPAAFASVTESIFIDGCLVSRSAIDISIINVNTSTMSSWSVIRPHLKEVRKGDVITAIAFFVAIAFFTTKTLRYCLRF
jgi:hypothetical protein